MSATIKRLKRSTGTTNEASPCFKALKKQNDDKPLAIPEIVKNIHVCWDSSKGLLNFPEARISTGRNIDITIVRISVARSASTFSRPIFPSTADALAKIADNNAQMNQKGSVGIWLEGSAVAKMPSNCQPSE